MYLRGLVYGSGLTGAQAVAYLRFIKVFEPPFSLPSSQEVIAQSVGLTKPQLSKLLGIFVGNGWVTSRRDLERSRGGRVYESTERFLDHWRSINNSSDDPSPFLPIAEELIGLAPDTGFYRRAKESWGRDVRSRLLAALLIEAADSNGLVCTLTRADLVALTGMTYEGIKKSLSSMQKNELLRYVSPANPNNFSAKTSEQWYERARRQLALEDDDMPEVESAEVGGRRGFNNTPMTIYLNLKWLGVEDPLGQLLLVDIISNGILDRILMYGALHREAPDDLVYRSEIYSEGELSSLGLKMNGELRSWLWVAFSNPWQMYQTAKISSEAESQAVVSQPPGPDGRTWDNATDAWRHAYGNFLMSKKYGVERVTPMSEV